MSAYIIVDITIHDKETYARYIQLSPSSIAQYGGRFVVRGATVTTLEGTWKPERFVMLEFPDGETARKWWASPEYAEAKALRQSCSHAEMLLVEGPSFDPRA
jgi:uncharacterized protein (DUF1330 family)